MADWTKLPSINDDALIGLDRRNMGRRPVYCASCGQRPQVCSACSKGLAVGEPTMGCEEGVHLHPNCYRDTSVERRKEFARSRREAVESLRRKGYDAR